MSRSSKVMLKIALTAAILGATFWFVGAGRIVDAIARLHLKTWLSALAACLLVHVVGTFKWRFFMGLTGARLGMRDGFRCYAAGLFANLCLPTMIGGDVLRAGLAMAATRQKTAVVLGSLLDRFADFAGLAILLLVGFTVTWRPSSEHHAGAGGTNWVPFIVAGCAAAAAVVAGAILWKRWRPTGRAHKLLLETLVGLRRIRNRSGRAVAGLAVATSLQFGLLLVHRELGIGIGMRGDLPIWLFVWPASKLVAMIPISFGGLGVREAAFLGLAKPFGIAESVAVATSLAWQAIALGTGLAGGVVWILLTWRPEAPLRRAERRVT